MTKELHTELTRRYRDLATFAAGVIPTAIPLEPRPSEVERVIDDLELLWQHVDPLIKAYGDYVQATTGYRIDTTTMTDQLRGALEGNLTFEISCAADDLRQHYAEAAE